MWANKLERIINRIKAGHIFSCFVLVALLLAGCISQPPADNTLLETFKNQRDKFETLTNMLLDDTNLQKVASYYVRPEDTTVSSQRLQIYRQLLRELSLHSIERGRDGIRLTAYVSDSLPDDGVYKGYVYFPNGLPRKLETTVVDNLDELQWNPNHVTEFYRKIDKKWYLWFLA